MLDFKRSKEIFLKIYSNEDLANKIEKYINKNKTKIRIYLLFCKKNRWEIFLKQKPMMKLALVYAFLPTVWDRYKEKGICEEIFWDTMSDIKIWIIDHKDRTNEDGLYELHWIMHHMNLNIFKIGRLQYQKLFWYYKTPYSKDGNKINFGDKIINMHISRGEKLDFEACEKSLQMAKEFFTKYFPEYPNNKFMCHSWLLYPHNRDFMPENSNILKFQKLFEIVESKESPQQTYLWLYGKKFKTADLMKNKKETGSYGYVDKIPQKSSLQKSTAEYIKNGGTFGEGLGVIII